MRNVFFTHTPPPHPSLGTSLSCELALAVILDSIIKKMCLLIPEIIPLILSII